MGHIRSGRSEGATIAMGGERYGTEGYFIQPTIFTDVTSAMKIAQEEIFGPVIVVQKFKDLEEAIRIAKSTVYGLAAAIHTKNTDTAIKVSNALKAGTVWINSYNLVSYQAPFGGYKESGIGRELGSYDLQNYTQVKTVQYRVGEVLFP